MLSLHDNLKTLKNKEKKENKKLIRWILEVERVPATQLSHEHLEKRSKFKILHNLLRNVRYYVLNIVNLILLKISLFLKKLTEK